jgi:hypothetical protein
MDEAANTMDFGVEGVNHLLLGCAGGSTVATNLKLLMPAKNFRVQKTIHSRLATNSVQQGVPTV